jgi:hypothetical protein
VQELADPEGGPVALVAAEAGPPLDNVPEPGGVLSVDFPGRVGIPPDRLHQGLAGLPFGSRLFREDGAHPGGFLHGNAMQAGDQVQDADVQFFRVPPPGAFHLLEGVGNAERIHDALPQDPDRAEGRAGQASGS